MADLGLGPEVWLFLTLLTCLTLFFKFGRLWSVRNLDLVLLFAPAPGLFLLVGNEGGHPWVAYLGLFVGAFLWFVRCLMDLGLSRRPMLEPNLNAGGLALMCLGLLGLLMFEAAVLPDVFGNPRNPADPHAEPNSTPSPPPPDATAPERTVHNVLSHAPPPGTLRRVLAVLAHAGIVGALLAVGWRVYGRPISALGMAACYLVLPYSRIAVVDTGQLIPAALIAWAVLFYDDPRVTAILVGLAASWMPAAIGLVPLWAGFYRGRGARRFLSVSGSLLAACGGLAMAVGPLSGWARALGARSLAEAGLLPGIEAPSAGSFWTDVDPVFRLPVLVGYLALVSAFVFWPAEKNLAHLLALSAALVVASQFWYLDEGGTLVVLYMPLVLLMVFRPNLTSRRPRAPAEHTPARPSVHLVP
jgi:hypothetical protein